MRGVSREFRRRGLLLCLTLLLALGLAASSSAHDAAHSSDHGDHACVACHVPALETPPAPALAARSLAPALAPQRARERREAIAPRTHRIPRAPPAR